MATKNGRSCGTMGRARWELSQRRHPECFYRGSTMLTTTLSQVEGSGIQFWFRLDSRLKHAGTTVFGKEISLSQQAAKN
jgi:hypothetical protein